MRKIWMLLTCTATVNLCTVALGQSLPTDVSRGAVAAPTDTTTAPAEGALQDIVVTAQRRSERMQDVPVAITAVTALQLESAGITNTQDLSQLTPGLSVPQTAGYTQPHIRGVGSGTNGPGLEQPVATYVDGVYIASAPSSLLTLNNIEQVEVLKGPQGTLFGRNATGGLIQILTKDPQQDFHGDVRLTYANYQDEIAEAYLTGGLAANLAADVAVRYEHQGEGWGRNIATGADTDQLNRDLAVRSKFLYEPTPDTHIRLSLDYENRLGSQDVQHLDPQYPGTFNNAFFGGPYPLGSRFDVNDNINTYDYLRAGGASLQINQGLGWANFLSITAYRDSTFFFLLDADLTPADVLSIPGTAKQGQFTQEFQLSSTVGAPLKWVAGLFYFNAQDRWDPLDVNFGPTVVSPVAGIPTVAGTRDEQKTNSLAGYGQATYEIIPDTNLTLGGRYTYESKRFEGTQTFAVAGTVVSTTAFPDPSLGIPGNIDFRNFSYRVALDHKFSRDLLGYLSFNTGFKSGGFNTDVPSNVPYLPEKIGALEAGLKAEALDQRLRINTALYRYSYSNIQVARFIQGNEVLYNGARATLYGADTDAEVAVTEALLFSGGLAYNHARFAEFNNADFFAPVGTCVPAPGGTCPGNAAGKTLPYAPAFTFNVGANYKVLSPIGRLDFNATYFRSTRFYGHPDNIGVQPAYDLTNLSLTWTNLDEKLSLKGWTKNLGNTTYATSLVEAQQGLVRELGTPRTYGLTVGYKF